MAKSYPSFGGSDTHEDGDDDDIGALGSILSWDEDEEGGVGTGNGGSTSADRVSLNGSTLPDLVGFNIKDVGSLPQFTGISSGDPNSLTISMPTPLGYSGSQGESQATTSIAAPLHKPSAHPVLTNEEKLALENHHPGLPGAPNSAEQPSYSQQINGKADAQQAIDAAHAGAVKQALNAQAPTIAVQQQFALFSQPNPLSAAVLAGQELQGNKQGTNQFAFANDPNSFLRQLQVAQLQQQFNAVQQVVGAAQQPTQPATIMQQRVAYPSIPMASTVPAAPGAQLASGDSRAVPRQKKTPSTQAGSMVRKAPVVSASDTDGEISSMMTGSASKPGRKASSSSVARQTVEIDTSNMSPDEKAKANRDRNREHARNTRLRKKAYLEKLKSTVDELCRERDTLVSERAGAANILVDMHHTRTEVLMSFFALRSANEKRRELWASILEESCFACVAPVTPYRSFPASEVQVSKCQRTILGIDGMMADTASLHVLLNSLVDRSRFPNATIIFRYTLVTEEAVVAGNQMMARWFMSTLNATQCGARMEVAKQGMLCCKFNSAHKIIGLELMFDVMALMLQLKQAAGSDTFSVIPNTVQTCQRSFDKPMVMTLAEEPYTIVQVNKLWEEMTGYQAEEVVGKTSCRILEGEETDPAAVEGMMNEIRFKRPASAMIVQYKKHGERFHNFFLAYPLSTDSRITHYLHLSTHVAGISPGSKTSGTRLNVPDDAATAKANSQLLQESLGVAPDQNPMLGIAPIVASSPAPESSSILPVARNSLYPGNHLKRPPSDDGAEDGAKRTKGPDSC